MLERWPHVCCVKITLQVLLAKYLISTEMNLMKCLVDWIPLRICVLWRNVRKVGRGCKDQKNKYNFVPLLKRDQNKDSHGRLMQNSTVTALLVQGSRNTYHSVLFYRSSVTVLCKKMNQKTGSKLKE